MCMVTESADRKKEFGFLTLVLGLVAGGVLLTMMKPALWHDEAFSVLMIKYPWKEMFYRLSLDVHPPFYYLVFRLWANVFSDSVFSLRLFSLVSFLGFLTVWFLILRRFFRWAKAFSILLLVAFSPFLLLYAQEGRMYALGLLLLALAIYFLLRSLEKGNWIDILLFGFWAGLCALTHYFLLFSLAGLFVFSLWQKKVSKLKILVGWVLAGAIFSLWLPQLSGPRRCPQSAPCP